MPVGSRQELLFGTLLFHGLCVHLGCGCWFHCCLASSACITCLGFLVMPFLFSRCSALCVTLLSVSTCILTAFFTFFQTVFFSSIMKYTILFYAATSPRISKRHFALSLSPSAFCTPNNFSLQCCVLGIDPI